MYELVKQSKGDTNTLNLLADVLWALEFDLSYDYYDYHYLAELSSGISNPDAQGNEHYIQSIEAKIEELRATNK